MAEPFKRIKRDLVYKGSILEVYKDYVNIPNGNTAEWDFIGHKGAAAVVPVLEDGRILMVRQYRNALDRYTLEIPAGSRDSAQEPSIECAFRELEEETGYRTEHLDKLLSICTAIAFCDEIIDVYVAKNLIPSKQNLDEDEFVDVEPYTLEALYEMIFDGRIQDSKTIASLLAYRSKYCI